MKDKVVVIGGGASGLIAAISAAREGANVTLLEKMNQLGKKILATGNGKCNMTNKNCHIYSNYNNQSAFIEKVLTAFDFNDTLLFFKELGVLHREESEGRIYPYSEQAAAVVEVLEMEIKHLKIEVVCDITVKEVRKIKNHFEIYFEESSIKADKVIIACGGKAGQQYGSSGDGYAFAKALGHTIVDTRPALVQIVTKEWFNKRLKGVRAKGRVSLECSNQIIGESRGEIQFTEDGFSGICVFDISREVGHHHIDKELYVILDLFPDMHFEDIITMLQMRVAYAHKKTIEELLVGMAHKKLVPVILRLSGLEDSSKLAVTLSEKQLKQIASLLKHWKVRLKGTRGWEHAQVTAGGISISEINPATLESLLLPGLFYAGEIIDVDGICGGYNLQWAWSSGYVAGKNAAK